MVSVSMQANGKQLSLSNNDIGIANAFYTAGPECLQSPHGCARYRYRFVVSESRHGARGASSAIWCSKAFQPVSTACAEVRADDILHALADAIHRLRGTAKKPDVLALSVMSPAWLAMDKTGKALTPIVTHQDRRSIAIAHEIESRIGKRQHLNIAGNRPFPGGISSTTFVWFRRNHPGLMKKADLVGHLNTMLHRVLTGQRVIDPSNASFTGLYETVKQGGWNPTLCEAVGINANVLPEIHPANEVVGNITAGAAAHFGLPAGLPVITGMVDTSAAMIYAGTSPGQLLNVAGSTDVLALCCARPHPSENLLCRALGIGSRWMSVATLAAAGSSITWIKAADV